MKKLSGSNISRSISIIGRGDVSTVHIPSSFRILTRRPLYRERRLMFMLNFITDLEVSRTKPVSYSIMVETDRLLY